MPHHNEAAGWTTEHSRRWFAHCDQCGTRRVVADYYEVYPPLNSQGDEAGWWWVCSRCLIDIINQMLEDVLPACTRVSLCCNEPGASPDDGIMLCSSCWRRAKFECAACHSPWPYREFACQGKGDLK